MKRLLARYGLLPAMDQETEYIGEVADVTTVGRGKTVVLCGQLVFASLTGAHPGRGFVRQYSRRSVKKRLSLRKFPEVHVFAEEEALKEVSGRRCRILFAVDHYLAWGLAQRGSLIVIGGYPSEGSTSLQLYILNNGQLRTIQEKNLPGYDNPRFPSELAFFLEETRAAFPSYKIYWSAPLPPLEEEYLRSEIANIGTQPFARHISLPVIRRDGATPLMHVLGLPLAVWGTLAVVYAGIVFHPYQQYRHARKEYETRTDATVNPQTCQPNNYPDYLYRSQTNKLEVIELQKVFLNQPMPQVQGARMLKEKLEQIASIPNLTIHDFSLKLDATPGVPSQAQPPAVAGSNPPTSMISFSVSVPKKAKMTALDQGNELLKELTRRMGVNLHLTPQGWQEQKGAGAAEIRIFNIEG